MRRKRRWEQSIPVHFLVSRTFHLYRLLPLLRLIQEKASEILVPVLEPDTKHRMMRMVKGGAASDRSSLGTFSFPHFYV